MSKAGIAYWSGTGNTEAMAEAFGTSLEKSGFSVTCINVSNGSLDVKDFNLILLGCPAMGSEELESDEFEPFLASVEADLSGKKVVLFGSYDWGSGDWMESFKERVEADGADVVDTLIQNNAPDGDCFERIDALVAKLA